MVDLVLRCLRNPFDPRDCMGHYLWWDDMARRNLPRLSVTPDHELLAEKGDAEWLNAMELTSEQKIAARLVAGKETSGKSYPQIAEEVGVDSKTLYNWRQLPEFQDAMASEQGIEVDELLLRELRTNPNPNTFNVYYKRFGLYRDEDIKEIGSLLGMTEDDRKRIIDYVVDTYGSGPSEADGPRSPERL